MEKVITGLQNFRIIRIRFICFLENTFFCTLIVTLANPVFFFQLKFLTLSAIFAVKMLHVSCLNLYQGNKIFSAATLCQRGDWRSPSPPFPRARALGPRGPKSDALCKARMPDKA